MGLCLSSHSKPPAAAITDDAEPTVARSGYWSDMWLETEKLKKKNDKTKKGRSAAVTKSPSFNDEGGGDAPMGLYELAGVPGRMFLNGANEIASIYTQQGKKGANQDAMVVLENFDSNSDTVFCGVFDGHGPYGHLVAKKVRDSLPLKLCSEWRALLSGKANQSENGAVPVLGDMDSKDTTFGDAIMGADKEDKFPEKFMPLKQSFLKAFNLMDADLKNHDTIDCFCSGTTAVAVVKKGNDLVIGNLGDSRAILATRDEENNLIAEQLTVDLKPNLPNESERIQSCRGRVFALQDEPDVARVWLPNSDSPGLAMARAFGDFCLKNYGLISVPQVTYRHLTPKDEFVILATDGVWDVLSNKEAVDIIASAPTRATAARALVDTAVRAWKLKFPTSKTDDCAVVCLFLQTKSSSNVVQDPKPVNPVDKSSDKEDTNVKVSVIESSLEQDDIVPVLEELEGVRVKAPERSSAPRLVDCISNTEDEEWSALQGVTRANSIISMPRFLSRDKKSGSWRKKRF